MSTEQNDESRIARLEAEFICATGVTCSTAYHSAINAGLTVMVSKDGQLVRVSPSGTEQVIRPIDPPVSVRPGTTYTLR